MLIKSSMPVGDRLQWPGHLFFRHLVQMSKFDDLQCIYSNTSVMKKYKKLFLGSWLIHNLEDCSKEDVHIYVLSLYWWDLALKKDPLDVLPLWLVLYVVALPIGDDLQRPRQGIHEVFQVLPPLKSCSKNDLRKVCKYLFLGFTFLHLSPSFIKIAFMV